MVYYLKDYDNTEQIFYKLYDITTEMFMENSKDDVDISIITCTLRREEFKFFFKKTFIDTMRKVRFRTIEGHTDDCIHRAMFDILFKYLIDVDFSVRNSCCDKNLFKSLQVGIMQDLMWKITIDNNYSESSESESESDKY